MVGRCRTTDGSQEAHSTSCLPLNFEEASRYGSRIFVRGGGGAWCDFADIVHIQSYVGDENLDLKKIRGRGGGWCWCWCPRPRSTPEPAHFESREARHYKSQILSNVENVRYAMVCNHEQWSMNEAKNHDLSVWAPCCFTCLSSAKWATPLGVVITLSGFFLRKKFDFFS